MPNQTKPHMSEAFEKLVRLAQAREDIAQGEELVRFLHSTGTRPERCGLPSVAVLEDHLREARLCYAHHLRALSRAERRALSALV